MNPPASLSVVSVDQDTGEVLGTDPRDARIAELEAEVENLKGEVLQQVRTASGLRGTISRITGARIEEAKLGPHSERAYRLIDAWQKLCNHEGCAADDDRFKVVLGALERREKGGMDMDQAEGELRKALFGASARPYLVKYEHRAKGTPSQRKDLIEYVLSNETRITKFLGFAQEHAERMLDAMVKPLVHEFGRRVEADRDPISNDLEFWRSPCPVCQSDFALWLQIAFSADLQWIRLKCSEGCDRGEVRDRLREMARTLRAAA